MAGRRQAQRTAGGSVEGGQRETARGPAAGVRVAGGRGCVVVWDQQRARVREALGRRLSSKHDPASNAFAVPGQPSINIASPTCFVAIPPFGLCASAFCAAAPSAAAAGHIPPMATPCRHIHRYTRLIPHLPWPRLVCSAPTLSRPDGPPQPAQYPMTAREDVSPALLLSGRHATWVSAA
jgi:hypothetical protein